jgi:hypothetical protein
MMLPTNTVRSLSLLTPWSVARDLTNRSQERWDDPTLRERYLEAVRWIERDMALMAITSHMPAAGRKPAR